MSSLYGFEANINARSLPRDRTWRFGRRYAHTTSNVLVFRQLLNSLTWDRIERYSWGEHGPGASLSFILERMGQPAQGMLETHLLNPYRLSPAGCTHMSVIDYNKVCQLYEAVERLSDEHEEPCATMWGASRFLGAHTASLGLAPFLLVVLNPSFQRFRM
ncbi:hypothetical protein JCGZ_05202 [Jatropha curcas]|uniref:Uncharacterized protein n=1 Tax=Jatropha curcas TaxID=180498 RepID=A0A067KQ36_JATCU|nr:hypothetical protein JCGZ_05202 [Jatropha curcas]